MTRGRRKDTTLPPSRALAIQRAYRDRKAKYVSDLEDRCRKAEEENERLRKELDLARSESTITVANSELASVCSGLMQNLEQTRKVLALFQQRVLSTPPQDQPESERVKPSATELDIAAILTHTLRQDPSAPTPQAAQLENTHQSTVSTFNVTMGDNSEEECCGGLIDCEGLIE
ncbi:hypothetical protein BGY98DRAFT_1096705 [Russula aff. rugulosa BPL654]|nr:hypothetical protein BGY98DRAFT_1096705 [Russula aff. rugulosa BPL654]